MTNINKDQPQEDKPIIICIDDEVTVLDSLKIELKKVLGDEYIIETAEGGKDAIELMEDLMKDKCQVALVLSDYIMPDIKGDEVLKRIHKMSPNTLKIMLTGHANLEAVSNAIKNARLYRYVAKPWQSEDLKLTIVEALHSYLQDQKLVAQRVQLEELNKQLEILTRDQAKIIAERTAKLKETNAKLEKANQELKKLSILDPLLPIANRRRFDEYLRQEWERLCRERRYLALIFADVDYFKQYNDEYQHQTGDHCLIALAKTIQRSLKRPSDLLARFGGEELVIVLPNTSPDGAIKVAERIQEEIALLKIPHSRSQVSDYVTISMGITAMVPIKGCSPLTLINIADKALYQAKNQGRNRFILEFF
ncbi:diguanylate cyclase domain-containing protein [Crocosphaera sp. XPORK-15E]|uniref:diguanylate cyclase domain-containing protein n=1 Tax=Crocosphaera sp. XPORK-15E TaxID=3110247 RepID=UPI002B20A865|nr:diguanylate cyclase [Crocosphaera sp. XPORK-15E]MEA5533369.1 diguanylate cyclase [Crocosphaera sp. XPORK-15E]